MIAALHYDPYDPILDDDPHPMWRRLRDEAPLYRNDDLSFYALSRYDDVLAGLLDWETFSSTRGTLLEYIDPSTPDPANELVGMPMIFTDPPYHDLLRRLVSRAFTPRRIAGLDQRIRDLCRQGLDGARDRGGFDYIEDFAGPIPSMVISELLGIPIADQAELYRWADMMMHYDPSLEAEGEILGARQVNPVRVEGGQKLSAYLAGALDERVANPGDDLISGLVRAEIEFEDGTVRRLQREELLPFFMLLFAAGSETTARLLGWSAVLLARHPEQRARLVAEPSLVPNAVEELLRYESPSPVQARYVTRDIELYGQIVPKGAKMALLNASGNRDERQFEDPDRFDVGRKIDRHLAFGYGAHFCLGSALARLEGRIVLEETLAALPEWDVDESKVEMVRTTTVRGPAKVPITF